MAISYPTIPPSYQQPAFDIPESQKTKEWYAQNVRYFSRFYNVNRNVLNAGNYRANQSPIQRGLDYMLYYTGQQQNIDFSYATTDLNNTTLPSVWIPGKKVKSLVDYILGSLREQMDNKILGVTALSKRAVNKRTAMLDALMLKYDKATQKVFEELQGLGIAFSPEGEEQFESQKEAMDWFNYTYKDSAEVYMEWIAKYIEESNDADTLYNKLGLDYCAANYCATYNYVENGKVKQKQIPFYNLIWDTNDPDPYNRNARFVGFRELLTPEEVFVKFPNLTDEERGEIKKVNDSDTLWNEAMQFYNMPNLNWWSTYPGGPKMVSVVTMFWKGMRDLRYEKSTDKFGNTHYARVRKQSKSGEYGTEDLYYATLIANKYTPNYGLADNVVRSSTNKGCPELPIKVYNGNTILGDGVSPIGLVAQSQDRIDLYRFKIIESVGRDSGKSYVINGQRLGEGVTSKQLLSDFKTLGVHVSHTSGEPGDVNDAQRLVEIVDLTLDPNIKYYLDLIRQEEEWMEQALSVSKVAMGQLQPQLGKAVQQAATQLSTQGLTLFFKDFLYYNQLNLQYACNLAKLVYSEEDQGAMVVGDRGVRLLKISKDFKWEDILLYIKVRDIIGESDKQRYVAVAQALAQNGQMDFLDFMRIDMAESKTALMKDIEKAVEERKQEIAEAEAAKAQQQMALQQANQEAETGREVLRQSAEDERAGAREQSKNFETMMKYDQNDQVSQ